MESKIRAGKSYRPSWKEDNVVISQGNVSEENRNSAAAYLQLFTLFHANWKYWHISLYLGTNALLNLVLLSSKQFQNTALCVIQQQTQNDVSGINSSWTLCNNVRVCISGVTMCLRLNIYICVTQSWCSALLWLTCQGLEIINKYVDTYSSKALLCITDRIHYLHHWDPHSVLQGRLHFPGTKTHRIVYHRFVLR